MYTDQQTSAAFPIFLGTRAGRAASERPAGLRYRLGYRAIATHTSSGAAIDPRDRTGIRQAASRIRARLCRIRSRSCLICATADRDRQAQNHAKKKDSFHKINSNPRGGGMLASRSSSISKRRNSKSVIKIPPPLMLNTMQFKRMAGPVLGFNQ